MFLRFTLRIGVAKSRYHRLLSLARLRTEGTLQVVCEKSANILIIDQRSQKNICAICTKTSPTP